MSDMKQAIEVMSTTAMKALMRKKDKDAGEAFTVYPYVNGREKGFMVSDSRSKGNRAVAFSEHRNSDSLVIFVGKPYKHEHEKGKGPLNFRYDMHDSIKLTDDIYYKHAYHVWCDAPRFFKRVGDAIAKYLNCELTEAQFGAKVSKIDKDAKKFMGWG